MSPSEHSPDPEAAEPIRVTVPDYVYPLIPSFLSNRRHDIATIRDALARQDYGTIRLLGHRMKGDGGSYGLDRISEIGAALEQAAVVPDVQGMHRSLEDLADFVARLKVSNQKT